MSRDRQYGSTPATGSMSYWERI